MISVSAPKVSTAAYSLSAFSPPYVSGVTTSVSSSRRTSSGADSVIPGSSGVA